MAHVDPICGHLGEAFGQTQQDFHSRAVHEMLVGLESRNLTWRLGLSKLWDEGVGF